MKTLESVWNFIVGLALLFLTVVGVNWLFDHFTREIALAILNCLMVIAAIIFVGVFSYALGEGFNKETKKLYAWGSLHYKQWKLEYFITERKAMLEKMQRGIDQVTAEYERLKARKEELDAQENETPQPPKEEQQ